mmetsp:Transcript_39/g.61  ORF Transcript_39/g.61 Transcript_39/m.61 type:complete len:218 (+) Transcript_39:339-992(+)
MCVNCRRIVRSSRDERSSPSPIIVKRANGYNASISCAACRNNPGLFPGDRRARNPITTQGAPPTSMPSRPNFFINALAFFLPRAFDVSVENNSLHFGWWYTAGEELLVGLSRGFFPITVAVPVAARTASADVEVEEVEEEAEEEGGGCCCFSCSSCFGASYKAASNRWVSTEGEITTAIGWRAVLPAPSIADPSLGSVSRLSRCCWPCSSPATDRCG